MDFADGLNKPFLELGLGHVIRQGPSRKRVIWGEFNKVTTYKDGKACRESRWVQYPMVSKSRALAPLARRVGCVGERFPEPRDKCTTGTDRLWAEGCGERLWGEGLSYDLRWGKQPVCTEGARENITLALFFSCPLISCRGSPLSKPNWKPKVMSTHDIVHAGQSLRSKC